MRTARPKTKAIPGVIPLEDGHYLGVVKVTVGYLGLRGKPFDESVPGGPAVSEDEAMAAAMRHAEVVRRRYSKLAL
jgi:hypothetical protein